MTWEVHQSHPEEQTIVEKGQKWLLGDGKIQRGRPRNIRNAKRAFEKKLAKEKNNYSRPFYSDLKGRTKNRAAVGPLKDSQGSIVTGDV
jgi:hypothetical protein